MFPALAGIVARFAAIGAAREPTHFGQVYAEGALMMSVLQTAD